MYKPLLKVFVRTVGHRSFSTSTAVEVKYVLPLTESKFAGTDMENSQFLMSHLLQVFNFCFIVI